MTSKKYLFWGLALLTSLTLAYRLATQMEATLMLAAGAFLLFILTKKNLLGLYIIIFLPVIGELFRLPLGPENGSLISDIFIPAYLIMWIIPKLLSKTKFTKNSITIPLFIFVGIGILSLIQALFFLKVSEVIAGSLYLIRFIQYALLYMVTLESIKNEASTKKIVAALTVSTILIAIAGFIQLIIYPDLGRLEEYGWDPHINRLVSTWLDPNFVGGLLAFMICILLGITLFIKQYRHKIGLTLVISILSMALFLTYSRSAYLALATGIFIIGMLKSRKLIIFCILIFLIGVSLSPRAEERVSDLTHSISSFIFNTAENPDATARLRIKSWQQTLELIQMRPFLGNGYNTLRYVKHNEGFVENTELHSASGSDSSLLTILATTGILGIIPFIMIYYRILKTAFIQWRQKTIPSTRIQKKPHLKTSAYFQGFNLGMFAGTLALLVHSFFVNSLLFPQILIFFWICVGISQWCKNAQ